MIDSYWRRCRLIRVVDGDTLDLCIDDGRRHYSDDRIRLLGVDAPEMHGETLAAAHEARVFVLEWFATHAHQLSNWPFALRTEKSDSFGRYLGFVVCLEDHVLNNDMLAGGYAVPYAGRRA